MKRVLIKTCFLVLFFTTIAGLATAYPNPSPNIQVTYEEISSDSTDLVLVPMISFELPPETPQKFDRLLDHQIIPQFLMDGLERPPKNLPFA